jgi:hypothetical protein
MQRTCCALAATALCRSARHRAAALWLARRSMKARAPALLCGRAGAPVVSWLPRCSVKRTPPCCCIAQWLVWHSAETHAAVLLRPGWRGALQNSTAPCCCALAGCWLLRRSVRSAQGARCYCALQRRAGARCCRAPQSCAGRALRTPGRLSLAALCRAPQPARSSTPPCASFLPHPFCRILFAAPFQPPQLAGLVLSFRDSRSLNFPPLSSRAAWEGRHFDLSRVGGWRPHEAPL